MSAEWRMAARASCCVRRMAVLEADDEAVTICVSVSRTADGSSGSDDDDDDDAMLAG